VGSSVLCLAALSILRSSSSPVGTDVEAGSGSLLGAAAVAAGASSAVLSTTIGSGSDILGSWRLERVY
jgi:hypothetical protein